MQSLSSSFFFLLSCRLVPVVKLRAGESEVKDATGMSGGERSYTTLALLMSLTNSIDSPFTCMDEFDVFMDEKNRRTVRKQR